LVDLLAAYAPWFLLMVLLQYECVAASAKGSSFGFPVWTLWIVPVVSPSMVLGFVFDPPEPPLFGQEIAVVISYIHFVLAVSLHRRFYAWLKFVVPSHLFVVSVVAGYWFVLSLDLPVL